MGVQSKHDRCGATAEYTMLYEGIDMQMPALEEEELFNKWKISGL